VTGWTARDLMNADAPFVSADCSNDAAWDIMRTHDRHALQRPRYD
jgi:hypothetical protein